MSEDRFEILESKVAFQEEPLGGSVCQLYGRISRMDQFLRNYLLVPLVPLRV